jgi:hypothetical protein
LELQKGKAELKEEVKRFEKEFAEHRSKLQDILYKCNGDTLQAGAVGIN